MWLFNVVGYIVAGFLILIVVGFVVIIVMELLFGDQNDFQVR